MLKAHKVSPDPVVDRFNINSNFLKSSGRGIKSYVGGQS
jgi:hypothetical protein